jgi:pimeloyl-ACP methyl ester carboxylesterase
MPQAPIRDGLTIEYETYGEAGDPPVLLVMGLGAQLIAWRREFMRRLAAGGRFVIAYDNRDSGLSSKLGDGQPADIPGIVAAIESGDPQAAARLVPYSLSDMAFDGIELLDHLGLPGAHVVGTSMGGMIAQTMAIEHPDRVLTLVSMMSNTGEPEYGQSSPEALAALLAPVPDDREGYLAAVDGSLAWRSRRYPELDETRELAAECYDRCHCPAGSSRQLAAIIVSEPRADALRSLRAPTLVIHGLDDTLIAPSGGERTAELIPDARLLLLEDMGHDRPQALWPQLCEAILAHTA